MKDEEFNCPEIDYTVHHCSYGVWIVGNIASVNEIDGLMRSLDYRGYKLMSREVAKRLNALVAVCRNPSEEHLWLEFLDSEKITDPV